MQSRNRCQFENESEKVTNELKKEWSCGPLFLCRDQVCRFLRLLDKIRGVVSLGKVRSRPENTLCVLFCVAGRIKPFRN